MASEPSASFSECVRSVLAFLLGGPGVEICLPRLSLRVSNYGSGTSRRVSLRPYQESCKKMQKVTFLEVWERVKCDCERQA